MGSGVVLFNVSAERSLAADSNVHIVRFYEAIARGYLTPEMARRHLTDEGRLLSERGGPHYYAVRDRFNQTASSLDFLFLNRSCFNGVMRFNKKGGFNVPFCKKPDRFRQAYVTKIVNQIAAVASTIHGRKWEFRAADWRSTLQDATADDFVYLDPPYIGRHTDYFNQWSEEDAVELPNVARRLPCGVALSMWKQNRYRTNQHLPEHWSWLEERTEEHFYHIGATEQLRNSMTEALMITPRYAVPTDHVAVSRQLGLDL